MKKIFVFVSLITCVFAFSTVTLSPAVELRCTSSDSVTIDECRLKGVKGSSDDSSLGARCNDEYTLLSAEQTDLDAILVNAVTNTKSVHSIP